MSEPGLKKVLILTYYWPPCGGAGVQRWLKFTKYMREFKYEPVIYTAENPEYPSIDESLERDVPDNLTVLKTRVWEPYKLYKWFTFQKKGHKVNTAFLNEKKKQGLTEKIAIWIRGNLFIPDARRFWIKPSVRYLIHYLSENPVDLIVSTGTPHSLHLIALKITKKLKIPWVADFRDPWTKIYYQQSLMVGRLASRKHQKLEQSVLQNAHAVTVVSQDMKRQFEEMGAPDIRLIPNGFDHEDFIDPVVEKTPIVPDQHFSITHVGTLFPLRNPVNLWKALSELVGEHKDLAKDLKINLAGAMDYAVSKSIDEANLVDWVNKMGNIPFQEAISLMKHSRVLLLLIINKPEARGILTGKLFEYMNAGRPILAIGPTDGEVGHVLKDTLTGHIVGYHDKEAIKKQILDYYILYREGKLEVTPTNIEKYSRKNLTAEMTDLFNEILQVK
jgi:glycosyltransferase involved in cell wall biosynthesis